MAEEEKTGSPPSESMVNPRKDRQKLNMGVSLSQSSARHPSAQEVELLSLINTSMSSLSPFEEHLLQPYDESSRPIWEIAEEISDSVPDEVWTSLADRK